MPPKGKGGGKKKAERERQEAEDARQKAEEDARLLEIRSKKERELKDLKEKEILEHIFKQEAERLAQEETEISQIEHLNNTAVLNIIAEQDEEDDVNLILIQWLLHIACKILPNVKVEADVNTYLSILSRESLVIEDHPSMNPLINQLENISSLYTLLETQLWLSKDAQNSTQFNRYNNHLLTLHEIVSRKCDELSADVLQHTDYLSVEANENFQLTAGGKGFKYGIWGNATKNPRLSVIDFASQNLSLSLPKPLALSNVAIRLIYEDHSTISTIFQEQVVQDKLHMSLVGGILRMDLVDFPEAPRTVESWTLRQILSPEGYLLPITYPFKKVVLENVDAEQEQPDATSWASLVSYLIPPQTFVSSENVKVMYFDDNKWCDDDISDVEVDVETGLVRFKTVHFKPTAVVQHTYLEFPYRDWWIKPIDQETALIHIQGKFNEIEIKVGCGYCTLMSPSNYSLDAVFKDVKMSPSQLLSKLSVFGLNFMGPTTLNGLVVDTDFILKNPSCEEICIIGISLCTPGFIFRQSPNNRKLASSKCTFQFKENSEGASPTDNEADFKSVLFDVKSKVGEEFVKVGFIVKGIADDTTKIDVEGDFSKTIHSSVFHLLRPLVQESNGEKIEQSNARFARTMSQILHASKIISW